jgi:hypothetical protein
MVFHSIKKQEILRTPPKSCGLNSYQVIETILWVDALVSGKYVKHPHNFNYAAMNDDIYTTAVLADAYPAAKFYQSHLQNFSPKQNLSILFSDILSQSIHYMYQGNTVSFANSVERSNLINSIHNNLAPGGYVVISYEGTVGWSEYKVVLDLLKEITLHMPDAVTHEWLDKVFYELSSLSLKKITVLKDNGFLNKLLNYLKSLDALHLEKVLKGTEFHTFYPSQIHQLLNKDNPGAFRFVGTLPVIRNYVKLGLDHDQKAFLGNVSDTLMATQRHDLITMPFQRADIWQRRYDQEASIQTGTTSDFYFGCVSDFDQFASKVQKGHVTLNFTDAIYAAIRKCLSNGFMTLDEIVNATRHLVRSPQETVDRLMLLIAGDQVRYTLNKPILSNIDTRIKPAKLRFCHGVNQNMFSDMRRFFKEGGIVIEPSSGLIIPFDQKTSMVIAAFTKVHETLVPAYCAQMWAEYYNDSIDLPAVQKEFKSILIFFKQHYFGKFLELGLVDQVLVE